MYVFDYIMELLYGILIAFIILITFKLIELCSVIEIHVEII